MKRSKMTHRLAMALVLLGGVLATACASYYKVTDPVSGSVYYTQKVDHSVGGAVTFKDARTKSQVTIQNSEIKEIESKEFDAGSSAPPAPKPAPAAAPAPASAPTPAPAPAPKPESGGSSSP